MNPQIIIRKTESVVAVGCSALLGVWINTRSCLNALLLAIRIINPLRPRGMLGVTISKDGHVCCLDDFGDFRIHGMSPLNILRKYGVRVFVLRLGEPFFDWLRALRLLVPMYRWVKRNRASKPIGERHLEFVCAHTPNVQSSGTDAERDVERKNDKR